MPADSDISTRKSTLRATMKARLAAKSSDQRLEGSAVACRLAERWLSSISPRCVMLTLPLRDELDPSPLIQVLLDVGITVAVPAVDKISGDLTPVKLDSLVGRTLKAGAFGVLEPIRHEPIEMHQLDVVIVPGLAFSVSGGRLGRGAGFFDRFLVQRRQTTLVAGLCFEEQVVAEVPIEPHDVLVQIIFTSERVIVPVSGAMSRHGS